MIRPENFKTTLDGKSVELLTLFNTNGMKLYVTNFGARVVGLEVPNKNGEVHDVVLGYDHIQDYIDDYSHYHGCTVGRFANRIRNGRFNIEGREYQLIQNIPNSSLHSNPDGFDRKVWDIIDADDGKVTMSYEAAHMEGGFPGVLTVYVTFTLTPDDSLEIAYKAHASATTIINLTNHCYFNLDMNSRSILDTELYIDANSITEVDHWCIPTGALYAIESTPLDFTQAKPLGRDVGLEDQQMEYGGGYDHNYVLNKPDGAFSLAAKAYAPSSGIGMEVWTTEPGIQLYTANFLDEEIRGKSNRKQYRRGAFCLETQHFPDSPNHPHFPSTLLKPEEVFESLTVYRFKS